MNHWFPPKKIRPALTPLCWRFPVGRYDPSHQFIHQKLGVAHLKVGDVPEIVAEFPLEGQASSALAETRKANGARIVTEGSEGLMLCEKFPGPKNFAKETPCKTKREYR